MVTRKRFRTVLNALALYSIAALVIGYFGVNAYSGNRGLRAKQDLDQQIAQLDADPDHLVNLAASFSDGPLVLVVDQFEELFTLCTDPNMRTAFVANLIAAEWC